MLSWQGWITWKIKQALQPGEFAIEAIQSLYDQLLEKGSLSARDALEVGCMVEVTDVNDLDEDIEIAEGAEDVTLIFTALRSGSYNHYWAFDKALKSMGVEEGCCALGEAYCKTPDEYPASNGGHDHEGQMDNGMGYGQGNGMGHGGKPDQTPIQGVGDTIAQTPAVDLTEEQAETLAYMWNEEKLAKDIYNTLYETWGLQTLTNIANKSEVNHEKALSPVFKNSLLFLDGHPRPVAHVLPHPGQVVEYRGLSNVGITREGDDLHRHATTSDFLYQDLRRHSSAHRKPHTAHGNDERTDRIGFQHLDGCPGCDAHGD